MDDGGEAVGGAARVGDDVVFGDVELVVVHADDDGDVLALGRGADDDLLRAGFEVALRLLGFGEEAGAFQHIVDAEQPPGKGLGAFLDREAFDLVAVDDEHIVLGRIGGRFFAGDGAVEFALGRIVLEEVGEVVGGDEIVDRDDVDGGTQESLFRDGPEDQTPDAAEAIDADFCHKSYCDLNE